jgi:ABC-type Zn uptake system ZnuABC Zn-binding protein ZnuA
MLRLKNARLAIRVGLDYDLWFDRLLQAAGTREIQRGGPGYVDASFGIAALEVRGVSLGPGDGHAHGSANPHYWLDPANGEIMSAVIAEALVRVAPESRGAIEEAQTRFVAELKEGLARWTRALEPYRGAPVVTYHNGWPYFARRFRLDIVDVIEPKEGVPPTAARLLALAAIMRARHVRVILHEPFEPIEASRALAERTSAQVVVLAPSVGSVPGAETYLKLFDHNVATLAKALAAAP